MAQPIASRVVVRSGSRFSFEAVPWAVCLAVDLTALRARVLLIDFMDTNYPGMASLHPCRPGIVPYYASAMGKVIYTAAAHVTGGRVAGHGRTSDGALEVDLRTPTEMGGDGGGTNPEQLFAVGYAACFESALAAVARRQKVETGDVGIDSKVMLVTGEERSFAIAVELAVTLPSVEDDAAVGLVEAAHKVCPYSNATQGNIEITLSVNGTAVDAF